MRTHGVFLFGLAACIEPPALRRPPEPLRVVAVATRGGDLDRLARFVSLTVRFDRPVAWPAPEALLLVRGAVTDGLRSDASDGSLSATHAARRVATRLARDPLDPSAVTLDALAPELPDTALTLLVTPLVRAEDGGTLAAPDAGPRVSAVGLTVAPARRCGAIARVEAAAAGELPTALSRVFVRFDRAVRGPRGEPPLALVAETGSAPPTRAVLDCFDDDGFARCAELAPAAELSPDTVYRVLASPALRARNGASVEGVVGAMTTGRPRAVAPVALGPSLACGADERAVAGLCTRSRDRSLELRAATTGPAVLRATATAVGRSAPARVALSAAGTLHALRLPGLAPATIWRVGLEVIGADGRVHGARSVIVATRVARPRVRVSEVLARPRSTGAQEYIELVNDDPVDADVSGWIIAQGAARSPLPTPAVLRARGRALVVGAAFDPRGDARAGDPPVAPGATVFMTRAALSGRGLRDTGADLAVLDATGAPVARAPAGDPARPPRAGVGLVRADTDLDEDDPAAWTYDAAEGCTPGSEDRLR
jgi:hypothetical protein